jgi:hypothetical protein
MVGTKSVSSAKVHAWFAWLKVKQPKYREGERGWEQRSR